MTTLHVRARDLTELMDDPDCDERRLRRTLQRFAVVNPVVAGWKGTYRRLVQPAIEACDGTVRLLDIGCGGGDVLRGLVRRARREGHCVEGLGIDPDDRAIAVARRAATPDGVRYRCSDSRTLADAGERFDVVVSNHLLHHLDDGAFEDVIADSERLATRLSVHSDIARSPLAYAAFSIGSLPATPGTFIRADGLTSIRRSHTRAELDARLPRGWRAEGDAVPCARGTPRRSASMSGPDHEVLVVGAGPTGLLVSAALSRRGVDVALIEKRDKAEPGTRAIGVHPPVLAALEGCGATARILSGSARVTRGVARTRKGEIGRLRFDSLKTRFPFIATAPQALTETAVAAGGPEPLRRRLALSLTEAPGRATVLTDGAGGRTEISARAVVVATGAATHDLVDGSRRETAYADRYLMTDLVDAPGQPDDTAIITLAGAGVLESFPLWNGGRRLVARVPATDAGTPAASGTQVDRLQRAVSARTGWAGLAERIETATAFGIRRSLLDRLWQGRVVVIGDAAHEVSPIGGQGMNLGLLDAATLAPVLARWLRDDEEAGPLRWEKSRLASARTAARLAAFNTRMGRPRRTGAQRCVAAGVALALSTPLGHAAAHAYAMGLDSTA